MNIKRYLVVLPFLASCSGVSQSNMGLTSSKKRKNINSERNVNTSYSAAGNDTTIQLLEPREEIGTGTYMINGVIRVFENGLEYPSEAQKAYGTYILS